MARFYDADYAADGRTDDIAFYSSLAREVGGPVLEMGCGSGRNLLPIARLGIAIHGIDSSPAMLRTLRDKLAKEPERVRRRVGLTPGDIRSARVGKRFRLVTAPFRVAQHLLRPEDRRAWLRNITRHLEPAGLLGFDVLRPDPNLLTGPREDLTAIERPIAGPGRVLVRSVGTRPDAAKGTLKVSYTWRVRDAGGAVVDECRTTLVFHLYTRPELERLLDDEGFEIRAYWGSFNRERFGSGSTDHVILASAPSHGDATRREPRTEDAPGFVQVRNASGQGSAADPSQLRPRAL
jgi:SAM-dependent methyltransferase